ncbi:hypothetical protein BV898_03386 [Hypsibius exemplaris]|uniref:Secreted protein n=1 Tax=Hypsibius exemplaris TaxID=2072580 RepID=A0A1W0X4X6_HYPEX|nr:hypothetical protein BV898_03386 [Hypsibius exemplaris]
MGLLIVLLCLSFIPIYFASLATLKITPHSILHRPSTHLALPDSDAERESTKLSRFMPPHPGLLWPMTYAQVKFPGGRPHSRPPPRRWYSTKLQKQLANWWYPG